MGKGMEEEGGDGAKLNSQFYQTDDFWKHELEQLKSQVDLLQTKLMEIKACILNSDKMGKTESEVILRRLKTTATLLDHLKSKAKIMANPHLAFMSCGIKHQEGIGLIDKNGTPLAEWSKNVDLSLLESPNKEKCSRINCWQELVDEHDGVCIGEMINSVNLVTDVMEGLVKRVIIAETEAAIEKNKANMSLEEIKRKALQVEKMSARIEDMVKWTLGTEGILKEMRQKVEDMMQEASGQQERAVENEQELCRLRNELELLRSNFSDLVSVRDKLILSSEKQLQTMEKLFERLIAKTVRLENEKTVKEAEVQRLVEENDRLSALLDKKEAQLAAMNEQCKFMAMSSHGR